MNEVRNVGVCSSDLHLDGPALNHWALAGEWSVGEEAVVLGAAGGSLAYRFEARDVNLVLAPPPGAAVRFEVLLDGQAPGDAHGLDVSDDGRGVLDEPRMYQLVRQSGGVVQRTFEITFLDSGVRAYVFTFG